MVVLPDGSRAPSGGGSTGVSFPAGIYQQTPTAACASDAAAPITGGLGVIGHQQAASGIYRCIACHYYQRPKTRIEYLPHRCYTLLVSIRQIGVYGVNDMKLDGLGLL